MSAINNVTSTQPPAHATTRKSGTPTTAAARVQPDTGTSSGASISPTGAAYTEYLRLISEREAGLNQLKRYALENPTSSLMEQSAYVLAHDDSMNGASVGGVVSLAGKTPNDPINYTFGAPVTVASQAYFTKQLAIYQSQALELYNTEQAKGVTPGQIVCDIYELQSRQPDAFRAMMMWPPAAEPFSIEKATNPTGAPQQLLNGAGQVVET